MCPQVELLKDHRKVCADTCHLTPIRRAAGKALAAPMYCFTFKQHFALLAVFEKIGTTQKG